MKTIETDDQYLDNVSQELCNKYSSYDGISIEAIVGQNKVKYADISSINWTKMRDMFPIYTIGKNVDPRDFKPKPKPKTGAGFLMFNHFYCQDVFKKFDIVLSVYSMATGKFYAHTIQDVEILQKNKDHYRCWNPQDMYQINTFYNYRAKNIIPWDIANPQDLQFKSSIE